MVSQRISNRFVNYKTEQETSTLNVLFIGLLQGIAITPGISRSGSTIAAALLSGLDREFAASFSFLLSIPVILGAAVLQIKDIGLSTIAAEGYGPYLVGMGVAAVAGYAAIRIVLGLVRQGKLTYFSYYCWAVGLAVLFAGLF
jgi:undecaprenyl-diphosphatase